MANPLTPQAMEHKKQYDKEYMRKNFRSKLIPFNVNNPTDMEMLDWINRQPEGGNKYVKRLVLADMEATKKESENV